MHYDDPNLRPKDFLYAVMHDRSAPIADRVHAASALMYIEPHGPPKPSLTIQITCFSDDDMRATSWWPQWVAFCIEQQRYFNTLPRQRSGRAHGCGRSPDAHAMSWASVPLDIMSEVKGHA